MHRVELLLRVDTRLATAGAEAKIPRRRVFWAGLSPPSCSVLLALLLPSGFLPRAQETASPAVIKLTSIAGSAHHLVWQTFLSSKSEYLG